jgi:hypothetical protein
MVLFFIGLVIGLMLNARCRGCPECYSAGWSKAQSHVAAAADEYAGESY